MRVPRVGTPGLHPPQPGPAKQEGDGRSPAGVFALGSAFGYAESASTGLPYLALSAQDYCVDVSGSPLYNRIVDTRVVGDSAVAGSTEPMRRDLLAGGDQAYKVGFVIEHNPQGVTGAGSCIFAHLWKSADSTTAGCTAMPEPSMRTLLTTLKVSAHPVFVLLPRAEYERLRARRGSCRHSPSSILVAQRMDEAARKRRLSNTARILLGLFGGAACGLLLAWHDPSLAASAANIAQPLGRLWLNALQMTVVPLVLALVVGGVSTANDAAASGRVARRAIVVFALLLAVGAALVAVVAPMLLSMVPRDPAPLGEAARDDTRRTRNGSPQSGCRRSDRGAHTEQRDCRRGAKRDAAARRIRAVLRLCADLRKLARRAPYERIPRRPSPTR